MQCLKSNKNVFRRRRRDTSVHWPTRDTARFFRTCDYVLWIERPCRTTEKHPAHEHDGNQSGRPERQRIRNSARATREQHCVMHLRAGDRTFFDNHLATAGFDSPRRQDTDSTTPQQRNVVFVSKQVRKARPWHPRYGGCSTETFVFSRMSLYVYILLLLLFCEKMDRGTFT